MLARWRYFWADDSKKFTGPYSSFVWAGSPDYYGLLFGPNVDTFSAQKKTAFSFPMCCDGPYSCPGHLASSLSSAVASVSSGGGASPNTQCPARSPSPTLPLRRGRPPLRLFSAGSPVARAPSYGHKDDPCTFSVYNFI
jgi:hypothetical protein